MIIGCNCLASFTRDIMIRSEGSWKKLKGSNLKKIFADLCCDWAVVQMN